MLCIQMIMFSTAVSGISPVPSSTILRSIKLNMWGSYHILEIILTIRGQRPVEEIFLSSIPLLRHMTCHFSELYQWHPAPDVHSNDQDNTTVSWFFLLCFTTLSPWLLFFENQSPNEPLAHILYSQLLLFWGAGPRLIFHLL